jgi:uncharacterized protein (DUF885 family)
MELCDKYLYELSNINSDIKYFLYNDDKYKDNIQENYYTESYKEKKQILDSKYIKLLQTKKKQCNSLSKNDMVFLKDLLFTKKLKETGFTKYLPIHLFSNMLMNYVNEYKGFLDEKNIAKKDYGSFLVRIKSLDKVTKTIIDSMRQGISKKITLYRGLVEKMIMNYENELITKQTLYESRFPKEWNQLTQKHIYNNLLSLVIFLKKEYLQESSLQTGLQQFKGGKELYREIVKKNTFDICTPETIHSYGIRELQKLIRERNRVEKSIGVPFKEFHTKHKPRDILQVMNQLKTEQYSGIYKPLFHNELLEKDLYSVHKVPSQRSFNHAYYIYDKESGGKVFINESIYSSMNQDELYVLSLHEGVPGHHLERYLTNNNPSIPEYIKMNSYPIYSEGWAFYCEGLYNYRDNTRYFYKIEYDILRTLRLIIDTGLHYYGWDFETCFQYMRKYSKMSSDKSIRNEIIRYLCIPGQALSYKMGGEFLKVLQKYYTHNGMSIQDFHKMILDNGPGHFEIIFQDIFLKVMR